MCRERVWLTGKAWLPLWPRTWVRHHPAMSTRVLTVGRELCWWVLCRLNGHPKSYLLQEAFPQTLWTCVFQSSLKVESSDPHLKSLNQWVSDGARECLFLVNTSGNLHHKGCLGNLVDLNHRGYCLYRRTPLSCAAEPTILHSSKCPDSEGA